MKTLKELLLLASFWPTFEDEERTQKARTFHGVASWTALVVVAFLLLLALGQPGTLSRRATSIAFVVGLVGLLLWLNQRGWSRLCAWLLVLGLSSVVTFRAYTSGGATAPALSLFVYICMVAGTLLGTRGGVTTAGALAVVGFWLAQLQASGRLPASQLSFTPFASWLYSCMALALSALLHPQITLALSRSLARAREELSARQQVERELRLHQEQLEQLVLLRTQQIEHAKEVAERASLAKGTFLATMSHEIRTPMNAILGYAQLLRREPLLTPGQRAQVETILTSGEHLLTLLNDVLAMSKIEAGRAELAPEPMELPKLLEGIKQMFSELARSKGLRLALELAPDLPRHVEADPGKVRQVVINLVGNALKFTVAGGVTVRAELERQHDRGYTLRIVVVDTGVGIDPADLDRVFGTFEQAKAGAGMGGTGLGLSIGRQLARLMGGDITVESSVGVGSSFTFRFESAPTSNEGQAKLQRGRVLGVEEAGGSRPKVLVVDDVADNVALATALLRNVGFEAWGAGSAEAGLELHDSWRPDLVLMDLKMPGIGGLEAIRRLRAAGSSAALVAFTASGFEELAAQARAVGAVDVIFKPYRENELLEKIASLLKLALRYEGDEAIPTAPRSTSVPLASLLRVAPPPLRARLREAALQARVQRLESLATELEAFSSEAAVAVRELARDYRYDDLAAALAD